MSSLPRKEDINVYDSLDERSAVRSFLGRTREDILLRLPGEYTALQEDLSFMGPVAFTYYAPAWEEFFHDLTAKLQDGADCIETLADVARWTLCIISIRTLWQEKETPEAVATLRRMLTFCENYYNSAECHQFYADDAELYGYAASFIENPPELEKHKAECNRLRVLLDKTSP